MKNEAIEWLNDILKTIGLKDGMAAPLNQGIAILIIVILAVATDYIVRFIYLSIINRILVRFKSSSEVQKYASMLARRLANLLPAFVFFYLLPVVFPAKFRWESFIERLSVIVIIILIIQAIIVMLRLIFEVLNGKRRFKQKPVKGFFQILEVAIYFIGVIIIVSILIDKSPAKLLTGLGASAAILTLIFKDTILGFVAGIQLSANDMLRPGDWIAVPGTLVNGVVLDVTLITIKVKNFDNTIMTVPPYVLSSTTFQNWRGMEESGGRRIMRYINIDMNSITFCTPTMGEKYSKIKYLDKLTHPEGMTNLTYFRRYLEQYLYNSPTVNHDLTCMVRQLQPTSQGIPIELYCFSSNKEWVIYEGVQADIFDHVIAMAPLFDLKIFQDISDIPYICKNSPTEEKI